MSDEDERHTAEIRAGFCGPHEIEPHKTTPCKTADSRQRLPSGET